MSAHAADRYAVFGHPVAHSRSPFIHMMFAQQTGQRLLYEALDVAPAQFAAAVRDFFEQGGRGLNLTVPHKEAGFALADDLSERARRAGAVNTFLYVNGRLLGENTDGAGLIQDLQTNLGLEIKGRRVLLLGAGGAARGVIAPLLALGPHELYIANRTATRAAKLAAEFASLAAPAAAGTTAAGALRSAALEQLPHAAFDLVINATAASLVGEVPQLPAAVVGKDTVCYDMAYGADGTVFVHWARTCGARAFMGLGMLVEQAAEAFSLWRGLRPDTAPVREALTSALGYPG